MKRIVIVAVTVLFALASLGYSEDLPFVKCRIADAKGTQTKAALSFRESTSDIDIWVPGHDSSAILIPYATVDKVSYEYTQKHRITTGAIMALVTPFGSGALLMLTKSKSNWLYIDYHTQDEKKTIVLKLGQHDLSRVFADFKTRTGKEVVDLGKAAR